jgi:hypothetical protein
MGGDRIDSWTPMSADGYFLTASSISTMTSSGYYSDQPKDTTLWTNERFVEEAITC